MQGTHDHRWRLKKERWSFRLDTPSTWSWIRFWMVLGCALRTILQIHFRIEPTQFLKSTHEFPICTMYSIWVLIVFQVSDKYLWISLKLDPCVPQGDTDIAAGRNDWLLLKFNFERIQRFQEKQPISPSCVDHWTYGHIWFLKVHLVTCVPGGGLPWSSSTGVPPQLSIYI